MLSILIPTYNYSVWPLVENIYNQCKEALIDFEIIVFDDASENQFDNENINSLENASFKVLDKNIGRCAIRNLLAKTAKFDWLLFLDSDVFPKGTTLVKTYLEEIHKSSIPRVIYGGIRYQEKTPDKHELLRWFYGNKREAVEVSKRKKETYLSFLTLNFLIHKSIFDKVRFNETIPNLRNDDLLFSYDLQQGNIIVEHIENWVYHLGIETSEIFLKKTDELSISYLYLWNHNILPYEYTLYGKVYKILEKVKLINIISFLFTKSKPSMLKNLKSDKPSMFIFDLYRLGYICTIK